MEHHTHDTKLNYRHQIGLWLATGLEVMKARHFFQDRDIYQAIGVKTRDEQSFRIRLRQDKTETSFNCSRHETLQDTGSKT